MQKKTYQKPLAEYIAFYSDEEITAELDIANYANDGGSSGDLGASGTLGSDDLRPGVPLD